MTNSWLTRPVISSITLALLEDSGYDINPPLLTISFIAGINLIIAMLVY